MTRRRICQDDPTPPMARPAFGIAKAAELLEMSVAHLRRLTDSGRGPRTIRRGTRTYFALADLMEWVSAEMDRRGIPRPKRV